MLFALMFVFNWSELSISRSQGPRQSSSPNGTEVPDYCRVLSIIDNYHHLSLPLPLLHSHRHHHHHRLVVGGDGVHLTAGGRWMVDSNIFDITFNTYLTWSIINLNVSDASASSAPFYDTWTTYTKSMWMMRSKKNLQRGSKQQTSVPNGKRAKWNRSNWTKRQTDRRTDTQWERQAQVCLHKMTASTERMKTTTTDDSSRPDSGQNWQTTATKTSVMTRAKRQFKFCMKGKTEKNRLEWNRM